MRDDASGRTDPVRDPTIASDSHLEKRVDQSQISVAQYGVGAIGGAIARLVIRRADMRLVGVIDNDPNKHGRDAGDVLGLGSTLGITVDPDPIALRRLSARVVMHSTGSSLAAVAPEIEAAVAAGCHVISTCEELSFPSPSQSDIARKLDRVARDAGVSVLGTGVNPGFVMDRLPATLLATCEEVEIVEIIRVVDTSRRRPQLQAKTGLGLDLATFNARASAGKVGHVGLPESARLLAASIGWTPDLVTSLIEPVLAEVDIESRLGPVSKGNVSGVHQTTTCLIAGQERVRLELWMAYEIDQPRDEIRIVGSPPVHMIIRDGIFGDSATAGVVVNSASAILEARPGLLTVLDLPVGRTQAGQRPSDSAAPAI
jgi:hypothetical protein